MIPGYPSFYSEGKPNKDLLDNFNGLNTPQVFYTWGPAQLGGSEGKLDIKPWVFSTDGRNIFLDGEFLIEALPGYVGEVRGTFDQLGRPQVIYKLLPEEPDISLYSLYFFEGEVFEYWYDTNVNNFVTTSKGSGRALYAVFDIKYFSDDVSSDYMFFWVTPANEIVFSVQRERHLKINPTGIILDRLARLIRVEMTEDYRLQIVFEKEMDRSGDWVPEQEATGNWTSE